jgi:hypothetical protein
MTYQGKYMMYPKKSFLTKYTRPLWLLMPALALATPALAGGDDSSSTLTLARPDEPGSVIVWPKFETGSVNVFPGTAGQFTAARTLIELGNTGDTAVTVHLEWVCPGATVGELPSVCASEDFFVTVSGNGKVTFNPSGIVNPLPSDYNESIGGETNTIPVPTAPCPRGYLIGWVVNSSGAPAANNVLVGDAVLRDFGTDLQHEPAITIQAVSDSYTGGNNLIFDGQSGHYAAVTGQVYADVSYDSNVNPPFHNEALILLSLDIKTDGETNDPTLVPLDFYNYNELAVSVGPYQFTCWGQVELSQGLDGFLTTEGIGTYGGSARHDKGLLVSGQAVDGINSTTKKTLLGIIETTEGSAPGAWAATTSYLTSFSNNSIPVQTTFVP